MVFVPTDESYATKILENVQSIGWEGFVKHPGDYVAEIILEFYTNINKSERTLKIGDPGVNSFHGEHTGYYQSQEFLMTIAAPPPTIFSERGEATTLVPMPYRNQIFSDVPPFHGLDTIGSPSNLFNEGPSVPPRRPELGDLDAELDFFQYNVMLGIFRYMLMLLYPYFNRFLMLFDL
ncbi:uncharacterized protein [Nicotiana tomentosiformis]|uniref:uncharacterized protein n=1 Tax=Nicotiana tomentosiformis TaxID=4098 RepID=UPI00388C58E8